MDLSTALKENAQLKQKIAELREAAADFANRHNILHFEGRIVYAASGCAMADFRAKLAQHAEGK
jgi:hypothetical protein